MAEAVLAPETEQTPPEDVANPTPEVPTEGAPEGDNQEETSFIDNILEGIDSESAPTADDGKGTTTDGAVPSTENLTPEQAKEQGRREREQELANERTSLERQNYLNGLNHVVSKDIPEKLTALAERYGMAPADVTELFTQFNRLNGALKPLYDHDLEQRRPQIEQEVNQQTQATVAGLIYDVIKEDLGDAATTAVQKAGAKTWGDFVKAVGKEYRKGYVPAADYTSKKAVKDLLGKYDAALKERGLSLADITGNGTPDLPPPRSGSGPRVTSSFENDKAFNEGRITPEQWKANNNRFREQERK